MDTTYAWTGIVLLGALHGINPGMGWLFAVALGLQERARSAVWNALVPLAAGHALAIGLAVLLAGAVGLVVPLTTVKWLIAATLIGFGGYRLVRSGHPRWGGMRVGRWDLTVWSFLMATAHGAGLMVLPFLFGLTSPDPGAASPAQPHAHAGHLHAADQLGAVGPDGADAAHLAGMHLEQMVGLMVTLLHTAGYLLVTGVVAVVVYEKLGLRLLRSLWFNLDRVWAGALILTGVLTPFV